MLRAERFFGMGTCVFQPMADDVVDERRFVACQHRGLLLSL